MPESIRPSTDPARWTTRRRSPSRWSWARHSACQCAAGPNRSSCPIAPRTPSSNSSLIAASRGRPRSRAALWAGASGATNSNHVTAARWCAKHGTCPKTGNDHCSRWPRCPSRPKTACAPRCNGSRRSWSRELAALGGLGRTARSFAPLPTTASTGRRGVLRRITGPLHLGRPVLARTGIGQRRRIVVNSLGAQRGCWLGRTFLGRDGTLLRLGGGRGVGGELSQTGRRVDGSDGRRRSGLDCHVEQESHRLFLQRVEHADEHVVALALIFDHRVALGQRPHTDALLEVVHLIEVLAPL